MPGLGNLFKSLNPFSRIERQLEQVMAAIDDLKAALDAIQTSLNGVADDVDKLLALVSTPNPDLTAVVAQAQSIRDQLASVDAKFPTT